MLTVALLCAVNSQVKEAGLITASGLFVDKITSSITTIPPPSWKDSPPAYSVGIVWSILLTIVIFALGVCAIAAIQRKCNEKADPFTYRAPRSIATIVCPCLEGSQRRSGGSHRLSHDDELELAPSNSSAY